MAKNHKKSGLDKLLLGAVVGAAVGSVVGAGVTSRNKKIDTNDKPKDPLKNSVDKLPKSRKNIVIRALRRVRLYLKRKNEQT